MAPKRKGESLSVNPLDQIITQSPLMAEVKRVIEQVAPSDITVLITGESGTGKELVARAVHALSPRRGKPLLTVNCGAIPEGIFESEIFGHEKGAFTSAIEKRPGYFEQANGGSLFLDEIGEMPLSVQVKLLRVLDTGLFMRVGGVQEIKVDVRIIAATNKDLGLEVARGKFRQDLYYRLKAINITLPPLRDRPEDIPLLVEYFSREFASRNGRSLPQFDDEAILFLQKQHWAGNVRELKNFVESILALSTGDRITLDEIYRFLPSASYSFNLPILVEKAHELSDSELLLKHLTDLKIELSSLKIMLQQILTTLQMERKWSLERAEEVEALSLDEIERNRIAKALQQFRGNRRQAARALGMPERTLYRKIKEYGL